MRACAVQISPCSIATLQPMMPGTAASTSTSSSMIAADLPPSSSVTRRMSRPQSSAMRLPTGVLPVKLTLSTPGCVTSRSLSCTSATRTLTAPGGRPASSAASAKT